ncbi:MAG: MmcQ/YjbR family DNA-binding protein [Geodermatophilaceae bacterium]|nr:MmcQ/YjbR family DNA-binding protein [Geodermatophilaceae bacterium]
MSDDGVEHVRRICLALPEASERVSHGEPTWFVRDRKVFVTMSSGHHGPFGFWCAAPPGEQEAAVASEPERYFRPPYVGGRGWLGVRLDVEVDWTEIAELVRESYRLVAPKRLVALLVDGETGT